MLIFKFFEVSKNLNLDFTGPQKLFQTSYDHMINYENVLQTIFYQTHQLSWPYDHYSRLKPFWSKKFKSSPKKTPPLKSKKTTTFYFLQTLKNGKNKDFFLQTLKSKITRIRSHFLRGQRVVRKAPPHKIFFHQAMVLKLLQSV